MRRPRSGPIAAKQGANCPLPCGERATAAPVLEGRLRRAFRDAVLRRFYRSDKVRHTPGVGLGLNLVAAIAKLHGFRFSIAPGPGCVTEIAGPRGVRA